MRSQNTAAYVREPGFSFDLRGGSLNPLIDASTPLLALTIRMVALSHFSDLEGLHKRMVVEMESIELELHRLGYDRVAILTHRYCLCTVLDEAVMCSAWGQNSKWSERSLLASFHNETWGGEKFFVVLDRLIMEPQRYIDLIEFLYLCLCNGFEGKYRVMHNGRIQIETIIKDVHDVIRKVKGPPDSLVLFQGENVVDRLHHVAWRTPVRAVVIATLLAAAALYAGYFFYTDSQVSKALIELGKVLGS
jgi:type VI secretion system protein ImpK